MSSPFQAFSGGYETLFYVMQAQRDAEKKHLDTSLRPL